MSDIIATKHCPFCGKQAEIISVTETVYENKTAISKRKYAMMCHTCNYRSRTFDTVEELIKWWNVRKVIN